MVGQVGNGAASPASAGPGTPGTPNAVDTALGKKRRLDDTPASGVSSPTPMTEEQRAARKADSRLKIKVLKKNPNLETLYKELVMKKHITEKEFWEGREVGKDLRGSVGSLLD